jgi:SET domain-containing protein
MMLVATEIRPSSIHGLGVFLLEPVRKGQAIWRFDSRIDRVYSPEEVASLPDPAADYIRTYSTWHAESALYVLCGDNGRFFNHSATPNTVSSGVSFGDDRAAEDLEAGTELTSDYRTICDHVRTNGEAFCPTSEAAE